MQDEMQIVKKKGHLACSRQAGKQDACKRLDNKEEGFKCYINQIEFTIVDCCYNE